ncbi:hypothetical protein ACHOLT_15175 [Desulfitobacterium sp. Sab5]|uniref:hypothetical protein n=1 Tax=Desulfitobacterium nosdiversum TaxID=3375356 RepID=UPI003CF85E1C
MKSVNFQYKEGGQVPDEVGLLISILVRYPEVCSVRYLREQHALKFQFLLFASGQDGHFPDKIRDAIDVFHQLESRPMKLCKTEGKKEEDFYRLTITRDVESMNQAEVGLIVDLVKGSSTQELVYDEMDLMEDELEFQEEIIEQILEQLQESELDKNFVAVREDGRVLVYKENFRQVEF